MMQDVGAGIGMAKREDLRRFDSIEEHTRTSMPNTSATRRPSGENIPIGISFANGLGATAMPVSE